MKSSHWKESSSSPSSTVSKNPDTALRIASWHQPVWDFSFSTFGMLWRIFFCVSSISPTPSRGSISRIKTRYIQYVYSSRAWDQYAPEFILHSKWNLRDGGAFGKFVYLFGSLMQCRRMVLKIWGCTLYIVINEGLPMQCRRKVLRIWGGTLHIVINEGAFLVPPALLCNK